MVAGGVGLAPFVTLWAVLVAARRTDDALFTARDAADELYCEWTSSSRWASIVLTTEDGTAGERGRITVPLARPRSREPAAGQPVKLLRLRPDADDAGLRAGSAQPTAARRDVSLEQVMGCGLGGCYSCVVPARGAGGGRRITPARASTGPVFDAATRRLGRAGGTLIDLSVTIGSLTLQEPAHRGERLFRLRRRVRRRRGPVVARRRRREGPVPRRNAKATRRRASSKRRPACSTRSASRASACTGSSAERLPGAARRRTVVIVNICGSTLDEYCEVARVLSDAEGVAGHRAEHLLPEHQGRRDPVRLQPDGHARRRQRRAQGDAAAGDPKSSRRTSPTSRRSRGRPKTRAPTPSRSSTRFWQWPSTCTRGGPSSRTSSAA